MISHPCGYWFTSALSVNINSSNTKLVIGVPTNTFYQVLPSCSKNSGVLGTGVSWPKRIGVGTGKTSNGGYKLIWLKTPSSQFLVS